MDGRTIDWSSTITKGIVNIIIWIVILLIPFIIKKSNNKMFLKISNIGSLFIMLIEVSTLAVIILSFVITDSFSNYNTHVSDVNKNYYLDESNLLNFSKEENIVFFMTDALEASFMNDMLEKYPEFKTIFSDFTYYDNTTGCSLLTYVSMPTLLTGETLEVGKTLQENINNCYENSNFYKTLDENGFKSELYVSLALIPTNSSGKYISNKVEKEAEIDNSSKIKLAVKLYKCVFYKYMPHFLKAFFYLDSSEFNNVSSKKIQSYFQDDVKINELLISDGIKVEEPQKTYKVIQMQGAHAPFYITKDSKYNSSDEYGKKSEGERRENQIYGVLKILERFINELKENGIYENTTIIISADHGFYNRYNPTLLVKSENEHHDEIEINHSPISEIEDFTTTILNIATHSKNNGKDIYDYTENESRSRKINNYYFSRDAYNRLYVDSNIELTTNSFANNLDNYYISNQTFSNTGDLDKYYKFNKKIDFTNSKNLEFALISGILERKGDVTYKGTTVGNYANIVIKPKETEKNIQAELKIRKVYGENQRLIIKVENNELYNGVLKEPSTIKFDISKDIWNSNDKLNIKLEFPDAHPYSSKKQEDNLGTDWVYRAFVIDSIKFKK